MSNNKIIPIPHPGETLIECLEGRVSQSALARHIGVNASVINDICKGRRSISPIMAHKLGRALCTSPQFWINLQTFYDIRTVKEEEYSHISCINPCECP